MLMLRIHQCTGSGTADIVTIAEKNNLREPVLNNNASVRLEAIILCRSTSFRCEIIDAAYVWALAYCLIQTAGRPIKQRTREYYPSITVMATFG